MLERLVEDGETLELVGELRRLVASRGSRQPQSRDASGSRSMRAGVRRGRRPRPSGRRSPRSCATPGLIDRGERWAGGDARRLARRATWSTGGRTGSARSTSCAGSSGRATATSAACSATTRRSCSSVHVAGGERDGLSGDDASRTSGSRTAASRRDLVSLTDAHVDWLLARPALAREGEWLLLHADTDGVSPITGDSVDEANARVASALACRGGRERSRGPPRHALRPACGSSSPEAVDAAARDLRRLADRPRAHADRLDRTTSTRARSRRRSCPATAVSATSTTASSEAGPGSSPGSRRTGRDGDHSSADSMRSSSSAGSRSRARRRPCRLPLDREVVQPSRGDAAAPRRSGARRPRPAGPRTSCRRASRARPPRGSSCPPAETTRSASATRLSASTALLRHDERRQRERADRVALLGRPREHDGLHARVGPEPLEHVGEERVPVAVVERHLGRGADDRRGRAPRSTPSASSTPSSGRKPWR